MRTAQEFKKAQQEHEIWSWEIHDCSLCGYECGYIFDYNEHPVVYDHGCDCTRTYRKSIMNWQNVADHYNMQTNPEIIKKYDKFWGFSNDR